MLEKDRWFSEVCKEAGNAISYEISAHLHEEQTPYQRIDIYQTTQFGKLMTIDGFVMLTQRDNFLYHEMMTHPALFTHDNPQDVMIVGGGDCGTLKEVMKHGQVRRCTQVEIDERVTRLAEEYFPELCEANDDPRAQLLFADAIQYMKDADAASMDLIIIDSTDPIGPAEGLFGPQFMQNCYRVLRPGGIIVQQSESPLIHSKLIKQIRDNMAGAGFNALQTMCFPQSCYPSGWWSATMAAKDRDLTVFRCEDVEQKSFATQYYNAGIHGNALALPEFLKQAFVAD